MEEQDKGDSGGKPLYFFNGQPRNKSRGRATADTTRSRTQQNTSRHERWQNVNNNMDTEDTNNAGPEVLVEKEQTRKSSRLAPSRDAIQGSSSRLTQVTIPVKNTSSKTQPKGREPAVKSKTRVATPGMAMRLRTRGGKDNPGDENVVETSHSAKLVTINTSNKRKVPRKDDRPSPPKMRRISVDDSTEPSPEPYQNDSFGPESSYIEIDTQNSDGRRSLNSSVEVWDPYSPPPPLNSSGKSILKNNSIGGSSCSTSNYSDRSGFTGTDCETSHSLSESEVNVPENESMVSQQKSQHNIQSKKKGTTINESGNHTRYMLKNNFNGKPVTQRSSRKPNLYKETLIRNAQKRFSSGSRSPGSESFIQSRSEIHVDTNCRTPGTSTGNVIPGPHVNPHFSGRVDQSELSRPEEPHGRSNRHTREFETRTPGTSSRAGPDFTQLSVVNQLMRHLERDKNRELASVLSRAPVGDMICEEVLKTSDDQRLKRMFGNLSRVELSNVAESVLFEKVHSLTLACKCPPLQLAASRQPAEFLSEGFLAMLFQLLDEAAKVTDLPSKHVNARDRTAQRSRSSMQKSLISDLALNIATKHSKTLRHLEEKRDRDRSITEHLRNFNNLLSNNFGGRGQVQWDDEMLKEAKLAANKLIEIIPDPLKFN